MASGQAMEGRYGQDGCEVPAAKLLQQSAPPLHRVNQAHYTAVLFTSERSLISQPVTPTNPCSLAQRSFRIQAEKREGGEREKA
ncbi:hypothetical protein BgiMline_029889 [Biomphalaria glabrata]|nr:hypothetical protein BgiMline_026608 [Biomphalaria glabrata]